MGRDARLRAARRDGARRVGEPATILRELDSDIRRISSESPRRCWEILVEILAHVSGINSLVGGTLSAGAARIARDLSGLDDRAKQYLESWLAELAFLKERGEPLTDPLG